jgi:drug/metabolite transporter (DMT)-like permease
MFSQTNRARGFLGVLLVVTSGVTYGTVPIMAKVAFRTGVTLPELLAWRFSLAAALLWIAVICTGGHLPDKRRVLPLVAMGVVGYTGQSAAFFGALQRIPASACALLLYTYPAIVTLAAAAIFREHLSARKIAAIVVAFVGTSLVVQSPSSPLSAVGIALALTSACIYSAYVLTGSRIFANTPPIAAAATVMTATAFSFATFAQLTGQISVPTSVAQAVMLAAIAVVGTAVPVLTFVVGMPRIGPSRASIVSTVEPVVTVLLATAVLLEPLHPVQIAGAALVLASVVVLEAGRPAEI